MKFISNSSNNKLIAKNTLLNFLGQIIPLIIAIICIPFIVEGLGKERFGILSLAWGILLYFSLFDLGLARATTKFISESLGNKETSIVPSLMWTSLFFNISLGFLGGTILFLGAPLLVNQIINIPPHLIREAQDTFRILGACVPIITSTKVLRGFLEGFHRFDLVNAVKAPSNSLNFLIPVVSLFFGCKLSGIIFLLLLSKLAVAVVYLYLCVKLMPALKKTITFKKKEMKLLFNFGIWVTVSNIITPLLIYLDRFLIGAFINMEAVTFYTVPYEIITKFWIIPLSLMITIFPVFSSLGKKRDEELMQIYGKSIKLIFIMMGIIVLLLFSFSEEILRVWLGVEFSLNSAVIFQILAIGVFINSLARIPFGLIQGIGRPDIPAKFHLLELPFYLVGVVLLIGKMGIIGAALAWSLRVGFDALLLFWAAGKLIPQTFRALTGKKIIKTYLYFLGLASLVIISNLMVHAFLIKIFVHIILFSVFLTLVWQWMLDRQEKKAVLSWISFGKRKKDSSNF